MVGGLGFQVILLAESLGWPLWGVILKVARVVADALGASG